jgi:flagellar hook-associated protein 1 FlgK
LTFLVTDPRAVAVSADPAARGDGANGLALVQALDSPRPALDGNSLHDHLDLEVNRVALEVATSRTLANGTASGVDLFRQAISEVSGVNTDEELMNMLEIQRAFQASAKFVTVVDELVGDVINLV